jgi:hypothetical protein
MGKIDKTQICADDNIKFLLGKINNIFDNFRVNLRSHKSGDNNRVYYYKLEPLDFLPKIYIEYFNYIY